MLGFVGASVLGEVVGTFFVLEFCGSRGVRYGLILYKLVDILKNVIL